MREISGKRDEDRNQAPAQRLYQVFYQSDVRLLTSTVSERELRCDWGNGCAKLILCSGCGHAIIREYLRLYEYDVYKKWRDSWRVTIKRSDVQLFCIEDLWNVHEWILLAGLSGRDGRGQETRIQCCRDVLCGWFILKACSWLYYGMETVMFVGIFSFRLIDIIHFEIKPRAFIHNVSMYLIDSLIVSWLEHGAYYWRKRRNCPYRQDSQYLRILWKWWCSYRQKSDRSWQACMQKNSGVSGLSRMWINLILQESDIMYSFSKLFLIRWFEFQQERRRSYIGYGYCWWRHRKRGYCS